jgi:VanZ family protein
LKNNHFTSKDGFFRIIWKTKIFMAISGICLLLLFIGGPNQFSPRSYNYAWDLGHILAFSFWSYVLFDLWKRISKAPFLRQCIWILLISLFSGILIELLQANIDRTPSISDILKDLLGSLVALAFFIPSRKQVSKMSLRILQWSVLFLLLLAIFPLAKALLDEAIARKQFPVLSTFETPFEIERWSGNSELTIDHDIIKRGNSSLKVPLTTAQYSGVFLVHFPGDWRNFRFLQFSIFNPSSKPLKIHCRVHDRFHIVNGQAYNDRFGSQFILTQGWNDITIPMEQILNAPVSRTMDLANIHGLGIFVVRLPATEVIYIDNVRLVE